MLDPFATIDPEKGKYYGTLAFLLTVLLAPVGPAIAEASATYERIRGDNPYPQVIVNEAMSAVNKQWKSLAAECGDSWLAVGADGFSFVEMKLDSPAWEFFNDFGEAGYSPRWSADVAEIAKLNGFEFQGIARLRVKAWRNKPSSRTKWWEWKLSLDRNYYWEKGHYSEFFIMEVKKKDGRWKFTQIRSASSPQTIGIIDVLGSNWIEHDPPSCEKIKLFEQ